MSEPPSGNPGSRKNLAELDRRISAARKARTPERRKDTEKYTAMSLAWRLIFELVASVGIGAAMGWGLDSLLGTLPLFLIVFVLLGCAAGFRTMLRTAAQDQRRQAAKAAREDGTHGERC